MRYVRRIIQALFLLFVVVFILKTGFPLETPLPAESIFLIDPLVAITTWIAERHIIVKMLPAVGLILLTLILGRVFCGWLCPMGFTIDISDRVFFRNRHQNKKDRGARLRNLKYYLLIFLLFISLFTVGLTGLFDPLSIFVRSVVVTIIPMTKHVINELIDLVRPVLKIVNPIEWNQAELEHRYYALNVLTFILFVSIWSLGVFSPRFWCRNLCPLGGLLGVFGRWSWLSRHTSNQCAGCKICVTECPMGAIESPGSYRKADCTLCLTCLSGCKRQNISFRFSSLRTKGVIGFDISRRQVLASIGLSFISAGIVKSAAGKVASNRQVIRPPGAKAEQEFLATCIKCGECMRVCLTNVLHPTLLEAGLEGMWTPKLVPRRDAEEGGCPRLCNLCTRVCPSEAIRYLSLEEKAQFKIGLAHLDRNHCLPWAKDKPCTVCYDYCPYYAIRLETRDGLRYPYVIDDKCTGCGICEHRCPVQGSAIIVVAQNKGQLESTSKVDSN